MTKELKGTETFNADVEVTVTLPMATDDEVKYNIAVASQPTVTPDTLSPVSYLIDWTLPSATSNSHGFSAYFPGHFYRFRDNGGRLQEYHADITIDPFTSFTPVQRTAQFMETLPVTIAREVEEIFTDTTYSYKFFPDTLFRGEKASVIRARRTINGIEAANLVYVFDAANALPVYIEKEMSPSTISEQTVCYGFTYPEKQITVPQNEEELIAIYPDAFAGFREGTYALASLKGKQLPGFSLPLIDGQRFTYTRGDIMPAPTIIAFVDETVASTKQVISDTRNAVNILPFNTDVIWIFLSNRRDDISEIFSENPQNMQVLTSGRNIVQDFGITETPSLIFVDRNGKIKDFITGVNDSMSQTIADKILSAAM